MDPLRSPRTCAVLAALTMAGHAAAQRSAADPVVRERIVTRSITLPQNAVLRERIVIAADGITIDGNGASLLGSAASVKSTARRGIGVLATGRSRITIVNLTVRGFRSGLAVRGGESWTIEDCDFSGNYDDPEFGWGDGDRVGGMILNGVRGAVIRRTKANRNWNGLDLFDCSNARVEDCDLSHCSNVCLKLWHASRNLVRRNNLSYGLRIRPGEVHARDSTCVLIESGSNDNRFENNDITHGGDGVFIRVLNGWVSKGNVFVENDCSFANNNGFEAWSPGNTYIRNRSNHCSYGFWLGGSDQTVLRDNEASFNGLATGFHNAPEPDFHHGGIVIVNGPGSHTVIDGNRCIGNNGGGIVFRGDRATRGGKWRMRHLVVQRNILERNRWGIFARFVDGLDLSANRLVANKEDSVFEDIRFLRRHDVALSPALRQKAPPGLVLVGPSRARIGEVIRFADGEARRGSPRAYLWNVDGASHRTASIEHTFRRLGLHRVELTVHDGSLSALAHRDVYVVPDSEDRATETDAKGSAAARWSPGTEGVEVSDDSSAIVGEHSVRVRATAGGLARVFLSAADRSLDLSEMESVQFWLRWRNPGNAGFAGPNPVVRLHASRGGERGSTAWSFEPVTRGVPRNLFGDPPHTEARGGWQLVSIPLRPGARPAERSPLAISWKRSLTHEGGRPPFVSGRLRFTTLATPMTTRAAASLTSGGGHVYCAADGGRLFSSADGEQWRPLPRPQDIRAHPDWINGMLTFAPGIGDRGTLLLTARARTQGDAGHGNRQLILLDLATERWRWHDTMTAMTHGATLVGSQLFGLAHAVMGNYGGPLCRVNLERSDSFDAHSVLGGLGGVDAGWLSRAAQLVTHAGKVYGIKNDWKTPQPPADSVGDRLFVFEPGHYAPSAFRGGARWDARQWRAAETRCRDLGPLPFEVGHGASLVALPAGFGDVVGPAGGLFVVAGCSPSNHEGHGSPSTVCAIYDIATREFSICELPAPTGAGTSACRHGGRILIKRGGVHDRAGDRELFAVDVLSAADAEAARARQRVAVPDLAAIGRLSLQFQSRSRDPFTIWIDGLRFVRRGR